MLRIVGPRIQISSPRVSWALVFFIALAAIQGWLMGAPTLVQADDSDPFKVHSHDIQGLVRQVWALDVALCENGESDLLVLSADGGPPSLRKMLTWMPCGASLVPGDPRIVERQLSDDAVVIDIATIPGRSGPQLLTVSASGIRVEALEGAESPLNFTVPGGLPLPPRPWEIGRVEVVADWNSNGSLTALVPALRGGWLIDLTSGEARLIEMPIYASYMTHMPFLQPSRRLEFVPFDVETERRHEATVNNYFARDIDGDTRADVVLSTIGGGLMDGRSKTTFHLNRGTGVAIDDKPDALRETEGGFSGFNFVDIDGDGREEIIETSLEFGIVQMIRILVTRKAETKIRVLTLDPESSDGTRTVFEDEFAFSLNFGDASVSGLIPSIGDWNGDGVQDLYVARSDDEIGFRLGSKTEGEPVFGRTTKRQPVPLQSGESRVADLNGDGLDEIVAFTDTDPDQPLVVLQNLGRLPGTRPELRSVPD
jgi:hypothetical protein